MSKVQKTELPFSMRKTSQFYLKQRRLENLPEIIKPEQNYSSTPYENAMSFNKYDLTENTLSAFDKEPRYEGPKVKPRFDPYNPEIKNTSNLENINYFFDGERWQTLHKKDKKDSRKGTFGEKLDEQDRLQKACRSLEEIMKISEPKETKEGRKGTIVANPTKDVYVSKEDPYEF